MLEGDAHTIIMKTIIDDSDDHHEGDVDDNSHPRLFRRFLILSTIFISICHSRSLSIQRPLNLIQILPTATMMMTPAFQIFHSKAPEFNPKSADIIKHCHSLHHGYQHSCHHQKALPKPSL